MFFFTPAAAVMARPELSTAAGCGVSAPPAVRVVARPKLSTAAGRGVSAPPAVRVVARPKLSTAAGCGVSAPPAAAAPWHGEAGTPAAAVVARPQAFHGCRVRCRCGGGAPRALHGCRAESRPRKHSLRPDAAQPRHLAKALTAQRHRPQLSNPGLSPIISSIFRIHSI